MDPRAIGLARPLPQEIIDCIIDEVSKRSWTHGSRDVIHNLKRCALTSRAFLPRSQKHIFSCCIRIPGRQQPRAQVIRQALQFLGENPKLTSNLHGLELDFRDADHSFVFMDSQDFHDLVHIINGNGRGFTTFKILGSSPLFVLGEHKIVSDYTVPVFAVYHQLLAPFITCLHFESFCCLPPDFISSCVNLAELSLVDVQFGCKEGYGSVDNLIKIQKLSVCASGSALNSLMHLYSIADSGQVLDVSDLRSLTVLHAGHGHNPTTRTVQKILDRASEGLEEYRMKLFNFPYDSRGYITIAEPDLSSCRKLRALEIDMLLRKSLDDPGPNQFSVVCDIFSRMSNLKEIRLTVHHGFSISADLVSLLQDHDWRGLQQDLNRILVGKSVSVELHIVYKDLRDCILESNYLPKPQSALDEAEALERQCRLSTRMLEEKFNDHQSDTSLQFLEEQ